MNRVLKITQAYSQTPWRKQVQGVGSFLAILVLGLVIAIIYVNVSAEAATVGLDIQELQITVEALDRSIADKEAKLAYITSAVEMEKRAEKMGFQAITPGQALYLVIPGYSGRTAAVLAPPSAPAQVQTVALSPDYSISLVDWIKKQLYLPTGP
ncbi:MAG TPA: hypothetical protein DEH25_01415 [Chloroflexi bacterium]|nr:hypothetical protein [Chloroflexota bacterium]